jgi:hypothetical protein
MEVDFERTTIPEAARECAFLEFLKERLGVTADDDPRSDHLPALLGGVAMLRESGTEFGASPGRQGDSSPDAGCPVAAEVTLHFPFHVSTLRDAYEDMDRKYRGESDRDATVARHTSLEASLREKNAALDVESATSSKTIYAEDVTLSHLLAEASHEGIRYVGIQATDAADAIFLARKIRDVAPDVRLAFFDADALLLHQLFRHDLLGSFVVSPYPFFGADDFSPRRGDDTSRALYPHGHWPFDNEGAEGTYNAVLASVGRDAKGLREYSFFEEPRGKPKAPPLPLWITTIGTTGLLPINASTAVDCEGSIYGVGSPPNGSQACSAMKVRDVEKARLAWNPADRAELDVDPDVTPPKLWHFCMAFVALGWAVDRVRQRQLLQTMPFAKIEGAVERSLDLVVGRSKHRFYAIVRTLMFVFAFLYMTCIQFLALRTYGASPTHPLPHFALICVSATFLTSLGALSRDIGRYRDQLRVATSRASIPSRQSREHLELNFHFALGFLLCSTLLTYALYDWRNANVLGLYAFGCTLLTLAASVAVAGYIAYCYLASSTLANDAAPYAAPRSPCGWCGRRHGGPSCAVGGPDRPSWVERKTRQHLRPLADFLGVRGTLDERHAVDISLAQLRYLAILAFNVTVWFVSFLVWDIGRHQFLDAFGRLPTQEMTNFVLRSLPLVNGVSPSAPLLVAIAAVYAWVAGRMARLRLAHGLTLISPDDGVDDGVCTPISFVLYGKVEDAQASALRNTERYLLDAIWRPSTRPRYFLALLGITLVPSVVFVLKPPSTLEFTPGTWELCSALGLVAILIGATQLQLILYWNALEALLKRIAEHPIGRAFDRIAEYASDTIEDQVSRTPNDLLRLTACARQFDALVRLARHGSQFVGLVTLEGHVKELREAHAGALGESLTGNEVANGKVLGPLLFGAARATCAFLSDRWNGTLGRVVTSSNGEPTVEEVGSQPTDSENAWLDAAESFVATATTLLINRHVRQFRYFLYTLTACALLLVLAMSIYPFEPQRLLLTCAWVVVGSVVSMCFWVFVELDLNTLLSKIGRSTPGKLTVDTALAVRFLGWVVVPLLGVAAAQYPTVANTLFSWVGPLMRTVR